MTSCGRRTTFVQNIGSPARQSFQRVTYFTPSSSSQTSESAFEASTQNAGCPAACASGWWA